MDETSTQGNFETLSQVYAQFLPQDIEEFYTGYKWWTLQQQLIALQEKIATLQRDLADNSACMRQLQPSAIALASLVRFQSRGVSDIALLDRMLERGEEWLDQTVQRLDYCEQFDSILYDYTQWCTNALEGAFDWIDSIREESSFEPGPAPIEETAHIQPTDAPVSTGVSPTATTEELFLQKLSAEAVDDDASLLEITLKQPAFTSATMEEPDSALEVERAGEIETSASNEASPEVHPTTERFEAEVHSTPNLFPEEDSTETPAAPQEVPLAVENSMATVSTPEPPEAGILPLEESSATTEPSFQLAHEKQSASSTTVRSYAVPIQGSSNRGGHARKAVPGRLTGFWGRLVGTVVNMLRG